MKTLSRYYRSSLIILLLISTIFFLSKCINREGREASSTGKNEDSTAISFKDFAGSASCAGCHQDIYNTHIHTAHFLTSAPAIDKYIKGSFEPGKNTFSFNDKVAVKMEKRDDGFYQAEYEKGVEKEARKMDIVVGSGTMGQSSLSWRKNYLLQMPITYFSAADEWSNSPGFPGHVVFNRVITSRCMECHFTFSGLLSEPDKEPEAFDRNKFIYGIDCEKCHGPGAKHVQFQKENPQDTVAKFILNPSAFNRQQKLDICTLCHGGMLQKTKPSFTYQPGEKLSDYFIVDSVSPHPELIDVHGNQYGLLRSSKCFKMSDMTCNTCHDTHKNEKGQPELFSQRCMNCHTYNSTTGGKLHKQLDALTKNNCIDCHMPLSKSRAIAVFLPGKDIPTAALIRSHLISVYDDESKRISEYLRKK